MTGSGAGGAVADPLEPAVTAPPFDYNPSAMTQRFRVAALGGLAAIISLYMGLFQWGVLKSVWDPVFGAGTATVLTSDASEAMYRMLGVPDAILGSWAYLTEVVLSMAGSERRWQLRPWMVILFGVDVIPLGIVSATLVVVQGTVVGAWCFPCLVTASISLLLAYLSYDEVWACMRYLWKVWTTERDRRLVWDVFWGKPTDRGYAIARDWVRDRTGEA